ncbi:MAG: hypothetical protein UHB38_04805, partial [Anaerovibrio sp.]|uniref:hypothetical protein n=1 Tax=Anaerovibrio sp. TaxID=1872532 RepID=UPI002E772FF3
CTTDCAIPAHFPLYDQSNCMSRTKTLFLHKYHITFTLPGKYDIMAELTSYSTINKREEDV